MSAIPDHARIDTRAQFARTATALLDERDDTALVYAEISGQFLDEAAWRHAHRVVNVGIREQLMINVAAGMAMTGLRPIAHTFGSFLVERAFEQIKLGFGHQDVAGVLVGTGGSYDVSAGGRTHQAPGDVALIGTLPEWTIAVPGHAGEVDAAIREGLLRGQRTYVRVESAQNARAHPRSGTGWVPLRAGRGGVVCAVGPVLEDVLAATADLDVSVLYTSRVRPFDAAGLARAARTSAADVVIVEPYLAGTSAAQACAALADVPHRLLCLGTRPAEVRRYGSPADHRRLHGLDAAGIAASVRGFLGGSGAQGPATQAVG